MISPHLAEIHTICHRSDWRPLVDGSDHPPRYVHLSYDEIDELLATGSFTLPGYLIPESVRKWRQRQDIIAEISAPEPTLRGTAARFSEIDETGRPIGESIPVAIGAPSV